MHQKKAISPIIAIIILLLITIAIAGAGYSYISTYWGSMTTKQIEVVSSFCVQTGHQGKILVKNIGTSSLDTNEITIIDVQTGGDLSNDVVWSSGVSDSSLVLQLRFDEGSGTKATDTSGQGNDGTLTGPPDWVDGKRGGALEFDGLDDYVDLGDDASLQLNTFTVSAWINVGGHVDDNGIAATGTDSGSAGNGWYFSLLADGRVRIQSNNASSGPNTYDSITGYTTLNLNTWYYVTVVLYTDGLTRNKIYVNGIEETSSSTGVAISSIYYVGDSLRIGHFGDHSSVNGHFNGTIDEVRIYSRALSPEEIGALANNTVTLQPGDSTTITHTCDGRCSYKLILGTSSAEAIINC